MYSIVLYTDTGFGEIARETDFATYDEAEKRAKMASYDYYPCICRVFEGDSKRPVGLLRNGQVIYNTHGHCEI